MNDYHYAQSDRRNKEKEYWTKLKELATENKILEFYKLYAQYLEWNNILSPDRKAIHKMAASVIKLIENKLMTKEDIDDIKTIALDIQQMASKANYTDNIFAEFAYDVDQAMRAILEIIEQPKHSIIKIFSRDE